jgi:hypothetical protein
MSKKKRLFCIGEQDEAANNYLPFSNNKFTKA